MRPLLNSLKVAENHSVGPGGFLVIMLLGKRGHTRAPGPSVFFKMEHRLKTFPFHMPGNDLGQLCVILVSVMLKSSDAFGQKVPESWNTAHLSLANRTSGELPGGTCGVGGVG